MKHEMLDGVDHVIGAAGVEDGVGGVIDEALDPLRGDAAAAAGKLSQAKTDYDQALEAATYLVSAYRNLSGAFRGLDARIPREMDQKGREALELQASINLRLAALLRRMNQPEVAVPLLVEVVQIMTPASPQGQKAYQSLLELGFVATPYTAATAAPPAQ